MTPSTAQSEPTLGPFRVYEVLGSGAMAEVRRAVHVGTDTPVAVKLIVPGEGRSEGRARALQNEVRALSALDHPGVVLVYDYGEVDAAAATRSGGALVAGTPWLAMELVEGGTLAELPRMTSFTELRGLLGQVLDALAHAHGRGLIHRDLKPTNVLMRSSTEAPPVPCLADFGIASAIRSATATPTTPLPAGTPRYMAPEQVLGRDREEGPSTDLYALGCIAWELVSGRAPFVGKAEEVCRAQVHSALPSLTSRFAVPESFGAWLRACLAKRSLGRFPSAAAARMALMAIDDATAALSLASVPPPALGADDIATAYARPGARAATAEGVAAPGRRARGPASIPAPSTWPRPRLPPAWPRALRTSRRLRDVGLGLYGLRPVPLAGRDPERDALWEALRDVEASGAPRIVCLQGATGVGKTRLGEWLLSLVAELGIATPLRAFHGEVVGPSEGLNAMLERALDCRGLEGAELEARVESWAREIAGGDAAQPRDLQDILAVLRRRVERFPSPADRHAAIRRCLARVTRLRPAVLLLDDAMMSADTLRFASSLRGAPEARLPLLVLITATDDHFKTRPALTPVLDALVEPPHGSRLQVAPLDARAHQELVEDLLGLSGKLAAEVEERTMGNPLFAIQLVGDWVQRRVLTPSEDGFRLAEGAEALIPDDLHAVCAGRVSDSLALLGPRKHEARIALELGAALGQSVHLEEWRAACSAAHAEPTADLLDRLAATGLVRVGLTAWSFAHGMLRECVERGAAEAERLGAHHALLRRVLVERDGVPERIAHHALASGDHRAALQPLELAAQEHVARGVPARAIALLDQHRDALGRLATPDHEAAARAELLRVEAHAVAGRPDEAAAVLERLDVSRRSEPLQATHAWLRGLVEQKRGETSKARITYEEAQTRFGMLRDGLGEGRCLFGLGESVKLLGELDAARSYYEQAHARFERCARPAEAVRALTGLADLEMRAGRLGIAAAHLEQAIATLDALGHRGAHAIAQNALGDLERRRGDYDAAARAYSAARATLEETGSQDVWFVRTNLALLSLARGDFTEAESLLREVELHFDRQLRAPYAQLARALRLPCAAAQRDWLEWDALFETLQEGLLVDPDVAFALELAAHHAKLASEAGRAAAARTLAVRQRRVMGAHDLADALERETH